MDPTAYFADRRQGDVLSIEEPIEPGVADFVVVSQSCDVVLPSRENVLLAPLVGIHDQVTLRGALNRENPRYVLVPLDSEQRFADLNYIAAHPKKAVAGAAARPGVDRDDDQAVRDFGLAVGRWFGRFAFPDEVQPWLAPLQKQIRDKYASPTSALGQVLHRVAEIRVEADSWTSESRSLTIHVIVSAAWMPFIVDTDSLASAPTPSTTASPRSLTAIAEELIRSDADARIVALWDEMAWALAASCKPKGRHAADANVSAAVSVVEAMLWTDEDFSLARYRRSEQLDVDFLSDPVPL